MRTLLGILAILGAGIDLAEPQDGRTCLALVGFSEARSESDACLATAMHTVIARSTDPKHRWPVTICDVALQPGQFEGIDNWPTPRHPELIDKQAWDRAQAMADRIIDGKAPVPDECKSATSFNQSVFAIGSVCKCGKHAFFVAN